MSEFDDRLKNNRSRYDEIKHLKKEFKWTKSPAYAVCHYTAVTEHPEAMKLTAHDVALLADDGNLCFGGRGFSNNGNGKYSGTIHTD